MDSERDRVLVLLRQALPGLQRDFAVVVFEPVRLHGPR